MQIKNFVPVEKQDSTTVNLKNQLRELIQYISKTGIIPDDIAWPDLKIYLMLTLKDECVRMYEKYKDVNRTMESNFEDLLKDLIDLFEGFEKEYGNQADVHAAEIMRVAFGRREILPQLLQVHVRVGEGNVTRT